MWQAGDTDPSGCATRASLGLLASDDRVSAKTEQPKNEEHDNHCADDIDDSIHDPFSCACRRHISYKKHFRSRGWKRAWLLPAARNTSMQTSDLAYSA
jgi:hypothetical protein